MKSLFFLFAFACYASTAAAQLTKGHWLVGGNGEFHIGSSMTTFSPSISTQSHYTEINVSANVGYFIMNKLAFGLKPSFSYGNSISDGGTITGGIGKIYLLGPFGRYYLLDKKKTIQSYN